MRKLRTTLAPCLLAVAAIAYLLLATPPSSHLSVVKPVSAATAPAACDFPTAPGANLEQTAWQLFVAANCPANSTQLVWETWIEQANLYPANGSQGISSQATSASRLHGSPLAQAQLAHKAGITAQLVPSSQCNQMNAPPSNVIKGAIVCEEVHINPPAQAFITGAGYQTRPPQTAAAKQGTNIQFPWNGIEVKVDWIPATDFATPFTCANPPSGIHVEEISGTCYAMAGMHISSKLLPNWLWVTFEPQSMLTNPLRCITFGPCTDSWGATPSVSNGGPNGFTTQTSALAELMTQAGLDPAFNNYRMDAIQTTFTNADGSPTYLGNSIIEGENVGMTLNTASCITCHSASSIQNNGTDGIINLADQVGPQYQIPSGWIARDFAWSLGLACPDVNGGLQNCQSSTTASAANVHRRQPASKPSSNL